MSGYDAVMGANEPEQLRDAMRVTAGLYPLIDTPAATGPTPLWDALLHDLGPLYDPVVTDWSVLHSQGVIAAAAGLPC